MTDDSPVVKLVYLILLDALKKHASEVHFELAATPTGEPVGADSELPTFRVLHRVAGELADAMQPPLQLRDALIARLKAMAQLDVALRHVKQEGGFRLRIGAREVHFALAIYPAPAGEKVVVRLPTETAPATQPN